MKMSGYGTKKKNNEYIRKVKEKLFFKATKTQ